MEESAFPREAPWDRFGTKVLARASGLNGAESANLDDQLRSHNPKVVGSNPTPATILRGTSKRGCSPGATPFFGKIRAVSQPEGRRRTLQPILLICKGFLSQVGKLFLPLGQIWDRNQFFPPISRVPNNSPNFPAASRAPLANECV